MEHQEPFRTLVDQLLDPASVTPNVLQELETLSNTDGLSLAELSTLLDLVFEPLVSAMVRNRLISKCLIPSGDYLMNPDVILRVLGSVGAPEIYYQNGKQHKSKRFSLATQQRILQWTISILPFLGNDLYRVLQRSLPILFGLLSYEFSRPYIATLIIVATGRRPEQSMAKSSKLSGSLRKWHVDLVIDLLDRFPSDTSLKALALHFSRSDISPDLHQLLRQNQNPSATLSAGGIAVPDNDSPAILRLTENRASEHAEEILQIHHTLSRVYKDFERTTKKRRIEPGSISTQDLFNSGQNSDQIPMSAIKSVPSLVANFEKINFINPSSVLSKTHPSNYRLRCLYMSLVLLSGNSSNSIHKKLSTALQHHIFSKDSLAVYDNFQMISFAKYGTLFAFRSEIERFMASGLNGNGLSYLNRQAYFMPYFHLAKGETILVQTKKIITTMYEVLEQGQGVDKGVISQIMTCLWLVIKKIDNSQVVCELLETIIPKLFLIMEYFWTNLDLLNQLSLISFMNASITFATEKLVSWSNSSCMIPPPSLIFKLVVSTNPLVVSEALGFIASIKKLKLSENDSDKSALKNAYVMDSINFMWREMAFKFEKGTINKGMYLHPHYLQRLNGLDFFSNSSLISTRSVGGIVQNPAFAYLCAELVWKLEDMDPGITTRHPGPISEATIANLQHDSDVSWLRLSYPELRVSLLNHLDVMGFHGLADLMFSSLKPLVNQRTRNTGSS